MGSGKVSRRDTIRLGGLSLAGIVLANPVSDYMEIKTDHLLQGQVALITGAARGIGKSIAIRLAKEGANIAICDIAQQIASVPYPLATDDELEKTKNEIIALGVKCMAFKVDVRNRDGMKKMVDEIKLAWNRLDILVSNAGIASMQIFEEESHESWDDVINVNLGGMANSIREVLPLMKANKYGRIICISSQLGRRGVYGASIYAASKWGMIGFAKSIAMEAAQYNITSNVICPSTTNTGMLNNEFVLKKINIDNPTIEGLLEKWHASPDSRYRTVLSPDQIADAATFFCMPQSGHLSGVVFDITSDAASNLA